MIHVTEEEIKECLSTAFIKNKADWVLIDGHVLARQPFLAAVSTRARELGWLDWGELIHGDQYGYHRARLTEAGRKAIGIQND